MDPLIEKKPSYQYGMVGRPGSNPVGVEPPYLPPTVQNAFGNGGSSGQGQGLSQSAAGGQVVIGGLGQVSGQASGPLGNVGGLAQACGPPGALGTDGGLGQTVTGGHGVVGNMLPIAHPANPSLIAGIGTEAAASGVYAAAAAAAASSNSRPSTGSSSQALGPLVSPAKSQGGYPPGLQTHGYGQAHSGPSSPRNSSVSSVLPSMGASSHQQQQRRTSFDPQATNSNDYEYQRYAGIGSASSSSSSMSGVANSSSQEAPLYDEEGRPFKMPPEKAPLVHLDGTLYQQPPSGGSRSGNAPPVYIE